MLRRGAWGYAQWISRSSFRPEISWLLCRAYAVGLHSLTAVPAASKQDVNNVHPSRETDKRYVDRLKVTVKGGDGGGGAVSFSHTKGRHGAVLLPPTTQQIEMGQGCNFGVGYLRVRCMRTQMYKCLLGACYWAYFCNAQLFACVCACREASAC
jgi:hypothetical protein